MPSTWSRRTLLLSAGAVLSVPLSGCSTATDVVRESTRVSIAEIWVKNLGDRPTVFDVVVEDAARDEVVFWNTYAARGMLDGDGDGDEEIDVHSWDSPVESRGTYVLHARAVPEGASGDSQTESVPLQTDAGCVSVTVEIGLLGDLSIDIDGVDSC
jgi:hypothetical protein